jgi:hypothetical protein
VYPLGDAGYSAAVARPRIYAVALFASFAAVSVWACNVYDASLVGQKAPQGFGIGFWSANEAPNCFSAKVPSEKDRPAASTAKDVAPIFLALDSIQLGGQNWAKLGFDLDGTCTRSDTCEASSEALSSCKANGPNVPVDGDYCRDNAFGLLAFTASTSDDATQKYNLSVDRFNCALKLGFSNYLVRISGYNGTENDDTLRVDFYPSPGLEQGATFDCSSPNWAKNPAFLANQPWKIQEDAVVGGGDGTAVGNSTLADPKAFVRNGYLIATLPANSTFAFPGSLTASVIPLTFAKAVFTGRLVTTRDGVVTLQDGLIGGRSTPAQLLDSVRHIGICDGDQTFTFVQNYLDTNVDLLADGTTDGNRVCDSVSVGVGFTARQATPGKSVAVAKEVPCRTPAADAGVPADAAANAAAANDAAANDAAANDAAVDGAL